LIVRHRLGYVVANAGIDQSNVLSPDGRRACLLLPVDPDASAARIRAALARQFDAAPAVIISDSFGRPWRRGVVNVALGSAGLPALIDRRGETDRYGRRLNVTEVAFADAIAAAAGLAMGEGAEGTPVVVVTGLQWTAKEIGAGHLVRPLAEDLFQ
jgi:coenzyme F420-0:L-glutamate ligase/coenzyme F420-1:gamma-L-glutamate ligase